MVGCLVMHLMTWCEYNTSIMLTHAQEFGHIQISSSLSWSTHKVYHVTYWFETTLTHALHELAACIMCGSCMHEFLFIIHLSGAQIRHVTTLLPVCICTFHEYNIVFICMHGYIQLTYKIHYSFAYMLHIYIPIHACIHMHMHMHTHERS